MKSYVHFIGMHSQWTVLYKLDVEIHVFHIMTDLRCHWEYPNMKARACSEQLDMFTVPGLVR